MNEVHLIEHAEQAWEILKPIRIEILSLLDEPRTCPEIAGKLGLTTQKVNYHMKVLKEAGLVRLVEERRNRGIMEGIYQAVARSFWFSPRLVKQLGGERTVTDRASLTYLLKLAERLQIEAGRLAEVSENISVPSLAVDARIQLIDASKRAAFMRESRELIENLARKYGAVGSSSETGGSAFRLMLACYPELTDEDDTDEFFNKGE